MLAGALDIKIPVWLYRILAIFPMTGIMGFDHYALGSTQTAFAKGFINVLTFGSWYLYDILQSLDADAISQKGLKFPFYEGGSIGAGRLAVSMEGLGTGGETLLNVLFTSAAAMFTGIAMLFEGRPPPVGNVAKTAKTVFAGATLALGGYTAYTAAKGAAAAVVPGAVAGLVPGGLVPAAKTPGGLGAVPSLGQLAKMVGGASASPGAPGVTEVARLSVTPDFIALGILFLLAVSGFTLSVIRERDARQRVPDEKDPPQFNT